VFTLKLALQNCEHQINIFINQPKKHIEEIAKKQNLRNNKNYTGTICLNVLIVKSISTKTTAGSWEAEVGCKVNICNDCILSQRKRIFATVKIFPLLKIETEKNFAPMNL
jgi:hypothetical protein